MNRGANHYVKPRAIGAARRDIARLRSEHRPRLILRGTLEWDDREEEREEMGCKCLSYGPIPRDGGVLRD